MMSYPSDQNKLQNVHQERIYQEYSLSRAESQLKQMEKFLTQQNQSREMELTALKGEIASLKKMMDEYKRNYSEMSEKLMQRNRQYQKLQGLYDSLRMRSMVVGAGGRHTEQQMGHQDYNADNNAGVAQHATPQRSPPFLSLGPEGDSRFLSTVEADGGKTFFQFSSPGRDKCRPFIRKH
ncbi:unnamed protein product [Oreochromis niloticus]|nr:unnamed protein product [Mustela putorius furo]